jgi:hypothetical protein
MDERRLAPRRLVALIGRSALAAGSAGLVLTCAGSVAAPSLAPTAAQVLRLEPNQLISNVRSGAPSGRGSSSSKAATSSSSVCWASSNWSGYAVASAAPSGCSFPSAASDPSYSGSYSSVSATWTVPTVTSSGSSGRFGFGLRSSSTYSAVWTGIDGFNNDDLIQAGTEQDYSGSKASYAAWWEILPATETTVSSITVDPGDAITVSINHNSGNGCASSTPWLISVTDATADNAHRGSPFTTCQSYSGPGASAEYVVEAPEVNGSIATLADYGSEAFGVPSTLTVNGSAVKLAAGTGGEMEQGGFFGFGASVVSVPSNPGPNGDDFDTAYGSKAPSAPTT